jgi:WD40 repeat protein
MSGPATDHPSPERLPAFGLGLLSAEESAVIERHVAECDACCRSLLTVADDALVSRLRQAASTSSAAEAPTQGLSVPGATAAPEPLPPELAAHPRYRVEQLLGAGGMGAVYRAHHRVLGRSVALKVINPALTNRAAAVERFARESRAAARLSHPNIVAAFDAEQAGATHFLVMEYVEGTDLARLVAEQGPLPVDRACEYVRQATLGLQHAFEQGMVHRDVKPHNLMLTPQGRVKILDFGLARFASEASSEAGITGTGTVLGTVDYIAPEQADNARRADVRSDLYSLGCTLYHLLAGHPPFPTGTPVQRVMAHVDKAPQPLAELRQDLPEELMLVLERMMAKSPARRHQTPAEVAAALRPFIDPAVLRGLRKAAPPAPPRRRFRRLAAAALALLLLGGGLLGVAVYHIRTDNGELVITIDNRDVEVIIRQNGKLVRIIDTKTNKEVKLDSGLYELELKGGPQELKLSLDKVTIRRGETVVATVERRPKARPESEIDVPSTPAPRGAVILFDGASLDKWEKRGGGEATWKLLRDGVMEVDGGDIVTKEQFGGNFKLHVEFRVPYMPNESGQRRGNSGVYIQGRYEVQILDSFGLRPQNTDCGAIYRVAAPSVNACKAPTTWQSYDIEFTAPVCKDGKKVEQGRMTVHQNGTQIHDNVKLTMDNTTDGMGGDPCTPGPILLQGRGAPGQFRNIWLVRPEEKVGEVRRFEGHRGGIIGISYAPDGRNVLSTSYELTVRLWDVGSGKEVRRFEGHTAWPYAAALSPDGRHVLSGGDDLVLRIWDAKTGKELRQGEGHTKGITWVAASPDGRRALTASWDGTVRLWDVEAGKQLRVLEGHTDMVECVAFAPDGKRALSAGNDGTIRLWDLETGKQLRALEGHTGSVTGVVFSPDGRRALSGGVDRTVRLWDVGTGKQVRRLEGHASPVFQVAFTPDGRRAISAASPEVEDGEGERSVRGWDLETGKELYRLETRAARRMAVSPDGRYALVSFNGHPDPRLWRLPDLPPPGKP